MGLSLSNLYHPRLRHTYTLFQTRRPVNLFAHPPLGPPHRREADQAVEGQRKFGFGLAIPVGALMKAQFNLVVRQRKLRLCDPQEMEAAKQAYN